MKTLKDFIKESQEINESLLGDIIRKLLDTSLSWIGSSAKWVADHVAKTTSELWNTTKHITDKGWDRLRFRSGYGGYGAPTDEYEYAKIMAGLQKEKDFNKRLKYIDDTFNELKDEIRSIFEDNGWFDEEEDEEEDVYCETLESDEPETSEPVDMIDIADVMLGIPNIVITSASTEQPVELDEVVEDDISFESFDAALNHRESNTETNNEPSAEINENITELIGGI